MSEITTTYTKTTFKVREVREDGSVFSTWGDFDHKWEALSSIDMAKAAAYNRDGSPKLHTYQVIKVVETTTEEVVA